MPKFTVSNLDEFMELDRKFAGLAELADEIISSTEDSPGDQDLLDSVMRRMDVVIGEMGRVASA